MVVINNKGKARGRYTKKVIASQSVRAQQKNPQLSKRLSGLIKDGQRRTAFKVVEETVVRMKQEGVERALGVKPQSLIEQVLTGLAPVMETEPVKRAGSIYQVPHPVSKQRSITLAVRQLVEGAEKRAKGGLKMREARFHERITAYEDMYLRPTEKPLSDSVNKRNALHKEAKANRVFSHRRQH